MNNISVMIKPASSACNMRCRYCFYADLSRVREQASYGMMPLETACAVLENVFSPLRRGDRLGLAFQGGEPTLAGLPFFREVTRRAEALAADRGVRLSLSLQTNGLLLDDDWCAFLASHRVLTGLSMDAVPAIHDRNRPDASGKGTWAAISRAKARLEAHSAQYNVLTVLTNELARHPAQVWRFITDERIGYIQLIPCLSELGSADPGPWALTPARFSRFYTELFSLWYEALMAGTYHSVKLFDDLINLLAHGAVNACGLTGSCTPQVVVEADGGAYPCDFYVTEAWRAGDLTKEPLDQVLASNVMSAFRERETPQPALCEKCRYRALCGGGCPRMRAEVCLSGDASACGYQAFLDACIDRMTRVARVEAGAARPYRI